MLNPLQKSLIIEAHRKYGKIVPVRGRSSFTESSFTIHRDIHGISWIYFWFNEMSNNTALIRKQITCPQCGNELTFADIDDKGHCVACEQRGQ